ncbi:alanine racemase [Mycetocola tolaasinivorans]|uniref:Alanine racemase n=1 Tax=Mycetocola tolaasinivorans TaxID=76635 RepID=A0A3L7AB78_9MICO|nr:alanine racemase [Mycetocola tolaasinivorans]RLP77245.1 alanine racemase [Mycetocola tolaasinivorans]
MSPRRELRVDPDRIAHNVETITAAVAPAAVLAVVKANAYGHGALLTARAARRGGAQIIGTADLSEALALRAEGLEGPLLCWLHGSDTDFGAAFTANIALAVSGAAQLERMRAAAAHLGVTGEVHLKVDTGLSRNGTAPTEWEALFAGARAAEIAGELRVTGLMSHLSNTSPEEDHAQLARFTDAVSRAEAAGLTPRWRHIAATAGALKLPETRGTLVRIGIGCLGLSPFEGDTGADWGLRPALRLESEVAAVRTVPAGTGVSYGYRYRTETETTLVLVPLGYADGIPRHASGRAEVSIGGRRYPLVGQIAMDQFIINLGTDTAAVGDPVVLIGDPALGEPGAEDWARAADTINYEIVTRLGGRITRVDASEPRGTRADD